MVQKRTEREWQRTQESQAGEVLGLGMQLVGSILLFLLVGRWLDARLHTAPWLLMAGVFVGAAAGFFAIYRQLVAKPRERKRRGEGE